ncbi:MAG TPA: POTRA domain-containing protein, partial [Gemmatimonadaceae bacterium]|nr:POTRA domain-containing protein [Gemmatimonadaceae bacterium]
MLPTPSALLRPVPNRWSPPVRRRSLAAASSCMAALLATAVVASAAQTQTPAPGGNPLISRVDLRGVKSVPKEQLELTLSTKSTYCRLPFLRPVCWFVRTPFLVRHHYLEPGELERDIVALRRVYWRRGFRETTVDTVITTGRHGLRIAFLITEGPPTIVDTLEVTQVGGVLTSEQVLRAVRLERGRPLDLASLDTGLVTLRNALWDAGHADATLDPQIRVDERARRATVRIVVDPRYTTRVGSVTIDGNGRLSDGALKSALTLREGGLFTRRDVLESQQYVYRSQGIATATIIAPPSGDSLKHLRVLVRENPPRRIGLTAGLNTVEFVQAGARAGFYALGGGRWQLEVRGATGNLFARQLEGAGPFAELPSTPDDRDAEREFTRPTWQGSAEITRLWAGSPRNRFTVGAFGHRRSEPAVFVDRGIGGFAMFSRDLAPGSPLTVGYRIERASVNAGDVYFCQSFGECNAAAAARFRQPRRLASVAMNWWLDRTDDAVSPSRGYTIRADADHASRATGSEYRHDRLAAEATTYVRLGPAVLATRMRGGWVRSSGTLGDARSSVLHPRALFFAGGSESVRGYDENQLGPRVLRVRAEEL